MKLRAIVFSPLCAVLAACVPSGITPQLKETPAQSLGLGPEAAPEIDAEWWKAFGDPQLDALVETALAKNPTLGEAMARLRAAKAGMEVANSALYPHADFNAQEERERLSGSFYYPPPYGGTVRWVGSIEADLSWNIDFWGKEAAALDKAQSLEDAARLDKEAARLAIESALVQTYVSLDRADRLIDVAADTEADRRNTLALTERRVRDGLDSRVEEQEAEALLAGAREDFRRAQAERDVVVHALAALEGRGAGAYATIGRPTLELDAVLPLPDALPADLLSRRPDVLAARARIDAATAGRAEAKAAFYPDVNLLATAGWAAIGLGPLLSATSLQYGGGPALHLPLFDAGKLRADYASATADLDYAVADYNGALTTAVQQTSDALTRMHALDDERREHQQMLDAAAKGYGLAATRYRSGLANQLTVLNAEQVLLQARQGAVELDAESASQRVALLIALGGGFEPPPAASLAQSALSKEQTP